MKKSQWKARQDQWTDTENKNRPEGKTWYHIIVILGLCFLLIDWLSFGEEKRGEGQGGGRILDVAGLRGWESWKLDNFHGSHKCFVPKEIF